MSTTTATTRNTADYVAAVVTMLAMMLGRGIHAAVHVMREGDSVGLLVVGPEESISEDRRNRERGVPRALTLLNSTEVRELGDRGIAPAEIVARALSYIPADLR